MLAMCTWHRWPGLSAATLLLGWVLALGCGQSEPHALRIGVMPKLVGIGYFEATRQGVEEAAKELGVDVIYDGPTQASSDDQVRMINTWLTQGLTVLAVAPNDPEVISQTLLDARDSGTRVITWDTDANAQASGRSLFINQAPNAAIASTLIEVMVSGLEARQQELAGDYLIVSGTSTAANQNVWMELMRRELAEKHPEMRLLQHLTPGEDAQRAQEQTAEAISAHPHLKGIWGITSVSLPAAAKAVRDAQRADSIYITGLSLPGEMRQFVEDGTVEKFVLWDPVDLGYLTVHVAYQLAHGQLPTGAWDFGRLKDIQVSQNEVVLGPPLVFTRENIGDHAF